jgi:DHA1 family bicyclomycin/chloramphenicol resistance-like MFS transporter
MNDSPGHSVTDIQTGLGEFVALMAFTMSLVALSIDAMLPAFPNMTRDLGVTGANDIQLVVSTLFIGLATGQLFYGPLSDSIGRKPAIYIGFVLFILGSLLSMAAADFPTMLAGRLLQGIGAAGPRTVSVALIRDRFHGSEMARVMSFIMTVFILVPIFAPALGQVILLFAGWRAIFGAFIVLALLTLVWLSLRQAETLPREKRRPFTLSNVFSAFLVVIKSRVAVIYSLIAGCVSGGFLGYLNTSQQIFQVQYGLGTQFPIYFGLLAVSVGCASLLNGWLVMRFGMHRLANWALFVMMVLSWLFLMVVWMNDGHPALWLFMTMCLALFFCIGVLFGNLNSIAMEPLGHVAGTAAAVIGSSTTLLAVVLGYLIGQAYDGTLFPMAIGFVSLISLSVLLTAIVNWRATPSD